MVGKGGISVGEGRGTLVEKYCKKKCGNFKYYVHLVKINFKLTIIN